MTKGDGIRVFISGNSGNKEVRIYFEIRWVSLHENSGWFADIVWHILMLHTIIGMLYTSIWLYLKKFFSLFLPIHLKYLLIKAQFLRELAISWRTSALKVVPQLIKRMLHFLKSFSCVWDWTYNHLITEQTP